MELPQSRIIGSRTIGTFYLIFAILAGLVGVGLSLVIRLDLSNPDVTTRLLPPFWLPFVASTHALIMIVFMMVPALFCGFANWLIPMMIGAADMQFKRLNLLALSLLPLGFVLLIVAVLTPLPLVVDQILLIAALHILSLSFLLSAINFIATIIAARAPFMGLRDMPPFIWAILVASFLMVVSAPLMTAALSLRLGGVTFEVEFSSPSVMMWFFTHPELFILLLPAFGIISQIVATFAGGRLVMDKMVKVAFVLMGGVGFMLWSQTMLRLDSLGATESSYQRYFSLAIMAFALPVVGVIVAWLVTIIRACYHGQASMGQVPMLWAMGFMSMILVAALSALSLYSSATLEIGAFIGHFHYILGLSGVFAIFAGWYFWFGKVSGYQIRQLSGKLHFWLMFIAVHLTFLPQHFGKQTHAADSWGAMIEAAIGWQKLATVGACFSALSLLVFFYAIVEAFVRKRPVAANPWGQGARGLEWQFAQALPVQPHVIPVPVRVRD